MAAVLGAMNMVRWNRPSRSRGVAVWLHRAGHVDGDPLGDRLQHLVHVAAHGVDDADAVAPQQHLREKLRPPGGKGGVLVEPRHVLVREQQQRLRLFYILF